MDLLALATSSDVLSVYRINWQKLFSLSNVALGAVAWTPSGNAIAAVSADGELCLWDTESGVCRQRLRLRQHSASFLSWSLKELEKTLLELYESGAPATFGRDFPQLPDCASVEDEEGGGGNSVVLPKSAVSLSDPTVEVAVVSLDNAVELWVMGSFHVLSLQCDCDVAYAWMASDWSSVTFVTFADEQLAVSVLRTDLLLHHATEYAALAVHDTNLRALLGALVSSLKSLLGIWRAVRSTIEASVDQLQKRLDESMSGTNVTDALMDILLCGTRVDGTLMWLESDMGEKGSLRLQKAVMSAIDAMKSAIQMSVLPLLKQLAFRSAEVSQLCAQTDPFAKLVPDGGNPYTPLAQHCDALLQRMEDLLPSFTEKQTPMIHFCNWLVRRQRLLQYEEILIASDEVRRKEMEIVLNETRVSSAYSELSVAQFMEDPYADLCLPMYLNLLEEAKEGETLRFVAASKFSIQSNQADALNVLSMPAEELKGGSFHSSGEAVTVALHRSDDVAMVGWESVALLPQHCVSVYDAVDGDVVGAEFYKDGTLLVLSCDEDAGSSCLALVRDGEEEKERPLDGCVSRLAVSRNRGLAAVYGPSQVVLFDIENDDEEDEDDEEDNDE